MCEKSCYFRQEVSGGASEKRSHLKGNLNDKKDGAMQLSGKSVQGQEVFIPELEHTQQAKDTSKDKE